MIVPGGPGRDYRLYDVCVVGAGPAGLAVALACAERGQSVALLEAGGLEPGPVAALSITNLAPRAHESTDLTLRSGLGGTSSAWGGTCVPYDPADFADPWWDRDAAWPISYAEMAEWYREAARFLGLNGHADFEDRYTSPGDILDLTQYHRIGAQPNIGLLHKETLQQSRTIDVFLKTTLAALRCDESGSRIAAAETVGAPGRRTIHAGHFVLAGGGLATTQMLMKLAADRPQHFGNGRPPLGRYYMGHLSGVIATLVFRRPAEAAAFLYSSDGRHVWKQRRIKLRAEVRSDKRLLNTAFVLRSPDMADPRHRNGALSAVSLARSMIAPFPGRKPPAAAPARTPERRTASGWKHVQNMLNAPAETAIGVATLMAQTRIKNMPRLLLNAGGRYALDYHAEQVPDYDSRIYIDPRSPDNLTVDFKFLPLDIESVIRSHEILDDALRKTGIGHLEYRSAPAYRHDLVTVQALDGYHQIGTTRMSSSPDHGIVNRDCRVFNFGNLYIASSSVFPTSGSANPTLTTVALARRLGSHLGSNRS